MAEQDRGYLGMTHNPFAVPGDGFFERGDRKTHLEQLRHLSQWSRRVLLVTGPHDSGKSILYRQLSASLEPRAKAARVNGAIVNTSREILAAIAQGYGIAAPGNANTQLLTKLIAQHVEEQEASDRFCVTLIDDAEIIEPRALDELMELVGRCSMRLVLFGEVRFVPLVERLAKRHEIGWHEFGSPDSPRRMPANTSNGVSRKPDTVVDCRLPISRSKRLCACPKACPAGLTRWQTS